MQMKADTEALDALAQSLVKAADALAGVTDALASASHALSANWTGQAQLAWHVQHAVIDARLRAKAGTLRTAATRAKQYADDLAGADLAGARAALGL